MGTTFHTLDVFTDTRFGGNPLAVVPDARELPTGQMQRIAAEFNLSETVFVLPPESPRALRRLRIFTPAAELPFAGHPTVGTAMLLADLGVADDDAFVLDEGVGPVAVTVTRRDGRPAGASLRATVLPRVSGSAPPPDVVAAVLSLPPEAMLTQPGPQIISGGGPTFLIAPVRDADAVARVRLDPGRWDALAGTDAQHVYVVAIDGGDVRARMFAPALGVAEDPATGAAAVALAGFLSPTMADGSHEWVIVQGVEMGRPSRLELRATVRDGVAERVDLAGTAVRVADGTLRV